MNRRFMLWVCMALLTNTAFAQNPEVAIPVQKNVPVYAHQVRKLFEQPIFTVGQELRLVVIDKGASSVQVENKNGRIGWITKNLVKVLAKSQVLRFQSTTVDRYADIPDDMWVSGDPKTDQIDPMLERSFAAEIKDNVDRESIERQAN